MGNFKMPVFRKWIDVMSDIHLKDMDDDFDLEFGHRRVDVPIGRPSDSDFYPAKDGGSGWRDVNYYHDAYIWANNRGIRIFEERELTEKEKAKKFQDGLREVIREGMQICGGDSELVADLVIAYHQKVQ